MTQARTLHRSFAAGEIAPEAFGRIDLTRFQTGLAECVNCISLPHGPVKNRPGFEYVQACRRNTTASVLIPFIIDVNQAYVLEFGATIMRVHTEGGTVLETAKNISGINTGTDTVTITAHGFVATDWVYLAGIVGTTELNGLFFKVRTVPTADTFTLDRLDGTNVDMATYGAYVSGGTASRVYTLTTPYAAADLKTLHFAQSSGGMTITHPLYQQRELVRVSATSWTLTAITFDPSQAAPTSVTATATGTGSVTYSYVVTAISDDGLEESFASSVASCTNNLATAGNYNTVTWTNASGAVRYNVSKALNGLYGYIGQALTGTTGFRDDNINADISQAPPEAADPFVGTGNYPRAVGYFEGRRWFGGTTNEPQGLWGSRSGLIGNMTKSIPSRDDDAITIRLVATRADVVQHVIPLNDLLLLTSGGEWRVTAQNSDAITARTLSYRPVGGIGASATNPVVTSESVVYAESSGGRLRELVYSWEAQGYKVNDLCLLAAHLFEGHSITSMAFSRSPHQIIWAVREDGVLLAVTYVPEHQVIGWHQHTTDGLFESVAVIPESDGDRLYASIRRVVNGVTMRYVERMAFHVVSPLADAVFLDACVTYDGAATQTISKLWHLEGATVGILADGAVVTPAVVTDGTITLPAAASKVKVGFLYESRFKTLPAVLEVQAMGLGDVKSVTNVALRVQNSSGFEVGPSLDRMTEIKQRSVEPYGSPPTTLSKVVDVAIESAYDLDASVYVAQRHPLPLTVLAMALTVEF